MGWFTVITEEMRSLGLSGTDLLVFAVIHGYSQSGEGCYYGSVPFLADICGVSDRTIQRTLRDLEERQLIKRTSAIVGGVIRVTYMSQMSPGDNLTPGDKMTPNNKYSVGNINITSTVSINKCAKFVKPTIEEVRDYLAQRRSSVSAEAFYAYYESNGWKVGRNPMKNWKQAVITWEVRDREQAPTPAAPSRQKEGFVTRNKRELEKLFGALPAEEGGAR